MTTYAELSAKLLNDSADFFETLGSQNPGIKSQMDENQKVFRQMAELIGKQPLGMLGDQSYGQMAGKLLSDAATFFTSLGQQNEPIREQMEQNASVFQQVAAQVAENPAGILQGE